MGSYEIVSLFAEVRTGVIFRFRFEYFIRHVEFTTHNSEFNHFESSENASSDM